MPREKKNKIRKDGRYCRKWHGIPFYSYISDDDAKAQRDAYKAAHQSGKVFPKMTLTEYALPWLKRTYPDVKDSTYTGLAIHLQHLTDALGDKKISDILPSDIKDVYSLHYKGLSDSYIRSAKQLYCALFDAAVADRLIVSNPAREKPAKPHKGTKPKERILTPQQRQWINTLCTDHRAYPAVMTMLYAGIRPQEAKAIDIDRDIDFEHDTITVRKTAHIDGYGYEFTDEGKTDWSNRIIPLFPPLKQALQDRHGLLITTADGEPVTMSSWRTLWSSYLFSMETAINGLWKRWYGKTKEHKKILADGGKLPPWIEFKIVPYTLRHAFCTMCRDSGVEINTCRKWMGHADTKMILKVYDSVSDNRSETERQKVENLRFGVQDGVQTEREKAGTPVK